MKIAILMSTYNGQEYLNKQLKSISEQDVEADVTVFIRDDGSSDGTLDIIRKWEKKLNIVFSSGVNSGPALSFWKLLTDSKIQADYYAFCDQDDIWDKNKLSVAVSLLSSDEEANLYASNCRIINEYDEIIREKRLEGYPIINIKRLFVSGFTQGCSIVFKDSLRSFIIEKKITSVPMHDLILLLYTMHNGKIIWDSCPRFSYRVHSNNVVANENKSFFKKIATTIWNWKNKKRNSMSKVAEEMIENIDNLSKADREYLECVINYKSSVNCKKKLLFNDEINKLPRRMLRSYRLQIILNLY